MGVVNITPDSFSDGGRYFARDAAIAHARELAAEGADIIDLGGESTRPGAAPVAEEEELARRSARAARMTRYAKASAPSASCT